MSRSASAIQVNTDEIGVGFESVLEDWTMLMFEFCFVNIAVASQSEKREQQQRNRRA